MAHDIEIDLDEVTIGSIEDYKNFKESKVGKDYDAVLRARLAQARCLLENEKDHFELLELQGSIKEIKFLLGLPDRMISDIEFDQLKLEQEEPSDGGEENTGSVS